MVFSGQLLAQMIMASDHAAGGAKDVRSVHAVFARAGTYTQPIELEVESLQAGRTWASDTVTAMQAGKLLSRATVLLNVVDEDLMRHEPPDALRPGPGRARGGARPGVPRCRAEAGARLARARTACQWRWRGTASSDR